MKNSADRGSLTVLAVTFALLALVSAYLAFRVYSKPEDNLNSITRTWHVLLVAVVLGSFCCIAGAVMAFGSAKSDIEAGWCVPPSTPSSDGRG